MSSDSSKAPNWEAFDAEAREPKKQRYDVSQKPLADKSKNTRRDQKFEEPNATLTEGSGKQTNCKASNTERHPAENGTALCSHHEKEFVTFLEDMGFEHRQVVRALKAAKFNPELAAEYLLTKSPELAVELSSAQTLENMQSERIPSAPQAASRDLSFHSSMAPDVWTPASSAGVLGPAAKVGKTSMNGTLDAAQGSFAQSDSASSAVALAHEYLPTTSVMNGHAVERTGQTSSLEGSKEINPTNQSGNYYQTANYFGDMDRIAVQPPSSTASHGQLELEMQKMIPVNSCDQDLQLSDADFDRITAILCQANREDWSLRPRTYALLRMINAIDLLDDFVRLNCWDIALPYSKENLPRSLSPEQRELFLKKQGSVLTKAARIEGGLTSTHANFADDADNHLESIKLLGDGGSASTATSIVDSVRSKLSGKIYVRKRLKRKETFEDSAKALKYFKTEVDNLKLLKHRHLVRYVGSYTDPLYAGIIMEPVADADLRKFLNQASFHPAEYDCIREAFGCLCAAIIYLKGKNIRHKDIKPENILVRQRKIYITDFGIARDWKALGRSTTTGDIGPISLPYVAPEVVGLEPRNTSADIWSLGCVYLDMITVLKGETLDSKLAHFRGNGTLGDYPRVNQEAFKTWTKKLESKKDNAPLEWIRNMVLIKPVARLAPEQLMSRILTCEDEKDYYGLCCDGKEENEVPIELKDDEVEDYSSGEDLSDNEASAKKTPDPAVLEKHLWTAARDQDVKSVKRWLRRAARLRNRCLNTHAIHRVAVNGNEEIANILIHFGCNLELKENGYTPLSIAVWNCREGVTELLAGTKVAIDTPNAESLNTPLHLAAQRPFRAGMRALLNIGASVDIRNQYQATPLHLATIRGDSFGVKLLLGNHASPSLRDNAGHSAFHLAAARGLEKIVSLLLDHGAEIDSYDSIDQSGLSRTALLLAVTYNKPAVVRMLLQRGASVNLQTKASGRYIAGPLHFAAGNSPLEIVEILLEFNPDLELRDRRNETPLVVACGMDKTDVAERLLAAGADIEVKFHPSHTLLTRAVVTKNYSLAQLLLDKGAKLDLPGLGKETLLHHAAANDDLEAIGFLIQNHDDIEAQDCDGRTPLMYAAKHDHAEPLSILLAHGATIDTRDRLGQTALHAAAANGSTATISLLLERGADPLIKSRRNITALGIATEYRDKDIVDLINKSLEDAGRIIFDSRWPGRPLLLTLENLQHGYAVLNVSGEPVVYTMPEGKKPKILPNNESTRLYNDLPHHGQPLQILGQPEMPAFSSTRTEDLSAPRYRDTSESSKLASLRLTDTQRAKSPDSVAESSSQDSRRSSSLDSTKAVYGSSTSLKAKQSGTENSDRNSQQRQMPLPKETSSALASHRGQDKGKASDIYGPN